MNKERGQSGLAKETVHALAQNNNQKCWLPSQDVTHENKMFQKVFPQEKAETLQN